MGIFYNPPSQTSYPNIAPGAQQPLSPSKIAAILPRVDNPPFIGFHPKETRTDFDNSWLPPFLVLLLGSNQEPYADALVTPPIPAPPKVPLQVSTPKGVLDTWYKAPDPTFMGDFTPWDNFDFVDTLPRVDNPPFAGFQPLETQVAINTDWIPPFLVLLLDSNTQPYSEPQRTPPVSSPSAFVPYVANIIYPWYVVPDPTYMGDAMPFDNFDFTDTLPIVNNPPFAGFQPGETQAAINTNWLPPFLVLLLGSNQEPYADALVTPPISVPVPLSVSISKGVLDLWYKAPDPTFMGDAMPFDNFDFTDTLPRVDNPPVSATAPKSIFDLWYKIPDPTFMGSKQPFNDQSVAPILTVTFNPPTVGASIPKGVLDAWWKSPDPTFIGGEQPFNDQSVSPVLPIVNAPPISQLPMLAVLSNYLSTNEVIFIELPSLVITMSFFPPIIGSIIPQAVLISWSVYQYQLQQQQFFTPSGAAPSNPPVIGTFPAKGVLDTWYKAPDPTFMGDFTPWDNFDFVDTLPRVDNPPFMGGARVSAPVLISYIPPDPFQYFNWAQPLQEIPAPKPVVNNPPFMGGSRMMTAEIINQIPPPPTPPWFDWYQQGQRRNTNPSLLTPAPPAPPIGAFVPVAVLVSHIPPEPNRWFSWEQQLQNAPRNPSLPIVNAPPVTQRGQQETLVDTWYAPSQITTPLTSFMPILATAPAVPIKALNAILASWQEQRGYIPQSLVAAYLQQQAQVTPNPLQAILNAWIEQPRTSQGFPLAAAVQPIVNNPPVIGSRVPAAVLNAWIPPPPMPPSARLIGGGLNAPIANNPPTRNQDITAILDHWYYQPVPLPQFSHLFTVSAVAFPHEIIRAIVTITAQSVTTLVKTYGAGVSLGTYGANVKLDT